MPQPGLECRLGHCIARWSPGATVIPRRRDGIWNDVDSVTRYELLRPAPNFGRLDDDGLGPGVSEVPEASPDGRDWVMGWIDALRDNHWHAGRAGRACGEDREHVRLRQEAYDRVRLRDSDCAAQQTQSPRIVPCCSPQCRRKSGRIEANAPDA